MCATLETWGSVWAIISGVIAFTLVVVLITKWSFRKRALQKLAMVSFESVGKIVQTLISDVSPDSQYLRIIITMEVDAYVERIRFCFKGEENLPMIQNLYDWSFGVGQKLHNVEIKEAQNHDWFWDYHQPLHRSKGSRIMIGVIYLANSPFNGLLGIGLTCDTSRKVFELPVKIKIKEAR